MHYCLAAAHHVRELPLQIDLVASLLEATANTLGEPRLHHHVGAGERQLDETRRLEGLLDVQAVVDDVRDDLDVGLRLIPASHHPETDAEMIALHEPGNHGLQRPL